MKTLRLLETVIQEVDNKVLQQKGQVICRKCRSMVNKVCKAKDTIIERVQQGSQHRSKSPCVSRVSTVSAHKKRRLVVAEPGAKCSPPVTVSMHSYDYRQQK